MSKVRMNTELAENIHGQQLRKKLSSSTTTRRTLIQDNRGLDGLSRAFTLFPLNRYEKDSQLSTVTELFEGNVEDVDNFSDTPKQLAQGFSSTKLVILSPTRHLTNSIAEFPETNTVVCGRGWQLPLVVLAGLERKKYHANIKGC